MNIALTDADFMEMEKALSAEFHEFLPLAWPVIDPEPYVHGWHMEALGEHLEAVADGEITRLLVNIPPGTSKSTAVSVMFPMWLWGPKGRPGARVIGASHEQTLATRDNRRCRQLFESEWFQQRWTIGQAGDQYEKTLFENERHGWRASCAVKSMTGRRGDVVIWDDPLSPEKAYSDLDRETANRVFDETLPTRLNNPSKSAIIVIMQRLHADDVSGHILAGDYGYEHLCLPMEFEPERRCTTSIGWTDPRTEEGELLMPGRFPAEVVERDKKAMGSFATAGQFQQRPVPRGGALLQRHWFDIVDAVPVGTTKVRGWDLAASENTQNARTAGVRLERDSKGIIYVRHAVAKHAGPRDVERLIVNTATRDGPDVQGSLPQDPGQAGKAQVTYLLSALAGLVYRATPESGDKVTRALPFAAQAEAGNVRLVRGDWNEEWLDEVCSFPFGKRADLMDATSRAFQRLVELAPAGAMFGTYA